jgi:ABC-type lipoprotein export system ATPase subunit
VVCLKHLMAVKTPVKNPKTLAEANRPDTLNKLAAQLLKAGDGDVEKIIASLRALASEQKQKSAPKRAYGEVVVNIEALAKTYKISHQKVEALKGVDLQIREGEYIALTGPSGSGKSTLLQLIGALDKPTSGEVIISGAKVSKLSDRKLSVLRNRTIGFVFQFFYLQPFLKLSTNLEVPGMFARTPKKVRRAKLVELATKVGLEDRLKHLPKELSGGQMQRAAIARALLNNPKILLADEPTGNLDRENAYAIMDLFDAIRDAFGTTIIMVTHDPELAAKADREVRLLDGKILL